MHEYSIVGALVARVDAEARARGATAVHRLSVRIGELSGVDINLLAAAYDTFRERTICDGAELAIESVPAAWGCPACGEAVQPGLALRCPRCDLPAKLTRGDEILLDRIEMEVP